MQKITHLWSRRHPRSCRPCGRHYKPLPCLLLLLLLVVVVQLLRDDFQGSGCCCLLLLLKLSHNPVVPGWTPTEIVPLGIVLVDTNRQHKFPANIRRSLQTHDKGRWALPAKVLMSVQNRCNFRSLFTTYLGNTVRVASGVTEQVGRATIRVLPRARRSWSVAIQVVRVFVGQT